LSARIIAICILLAGATWQCGHVGYIHAKATLAQQLLERSWRLSLRGASAPRPWPWADTWPVARLRVARLDVDEIVLAGSSGRTLAFGPAHLDGSALPGGEGLSVIAGHRDTHFQFLRRLVAGDELWIDRPDGTSVRYRVSNLAVIDARTDRVALDAPVNALELITCYPFDAVVAGGPLRYRVLAQRVLPEQHAFVAAYRRVATERAVESKVQPSTNRVML
jgi:sortase A